MHELEIRVGIQAVQLPLRVHLIVFWILGGFFSPYCLQIRYKAEIRLIRHQIQSDCGSVSGLKTLGLNSLPR